MDTKTWSWIIPSIGGIPPARRAFAVGGLLDGSHLTVAFGKKKKKKCMKTKLIFFAKVEP